MKTLYLMRHGKSAWDDPILSDRERPLLDKGIERTTANARLLKQSGAKIDAIGSSDAVRAVETAKIVRKEFGLNKNLRFTDPLIYDAVDVSELWNVIRSLPDDFRSVLLVGHNPIMTDAANRFLRPSLENLKTAGIVGVELDAEHWSQTPNCRFDIVYDPSRSTG